MRVPILAAIAAMALLPQPAVAAACKLSPKQVATRFMTRFYVQKDVRGAFEAWVDPGYIQHNPNAATGRAAAIAFLEPFFAANPGLHYEIKRVMADGNFVALHSWGRVSAQDRGVAVVDILRVQGCRVMEHWDVVQPVPEVMANSNGMF